MSATYLIDLQGTDNQIYHRIKTYPRLIEEHILGTNYTNLLRSQLNVMSMMGARECHGQRQHALVFVNLIM